MNVLSAPEPLQDVSREWNATIAPLPAGLSLTQAAEGYGARLSAAAPSPDQRVLNANSGDSTTSATLNSPTKDNAAVTEATNAAAITTDSVKLAAVVSHAVMPEIVRVAIPASGGKTNAAPKPATADGNSSVRAPEQNSKAAANGGEGVKEPAEASLSTFTVVQGISATLRGTSAISSDGQLTATTRNGSAVPHATLSNHVGNGAMSAEERTEGNGTGIDHDAAVSPTLGATAHIASLSQAVSQMVSPATAPAAAATLQNVPDSTAQTAHAPQIAAAPSAAAQPAAQSRGAAESQPAYDTAQLKTLGNVSELKISVQLPELGKVEVRAVSTHEATTAHITALRHDILPVLASERTGLEAALKSHDVMLGSIGSQTQGHANGQQGQQRFNASAHALDAVAGEDSTDVISAETEPAGFLPDHVSISIRA